MLAPLEQQRLLERRLARPLNSRQSPAGAAIACLLVEANQGKELGIDLTQHLGQMRKQELRKVWKWEFGNVPKRGRAIDH